MQLSGWLQQVRLVLAVVESSSEDFDRLVAGSSVSPSEFFQNSGGLVRDLEAIISQRDFFGTRSQGVKGVIGRQIIPNFLRRVMRAFNPSLYPASFVSLLREYGINLAQGSSALSDKEKTEVEVKVGSPDWFMAKLKEMETSFHEGFDAASLKVELGDYGKQIRSSRSTWDDDDFKRVLAKYLEVQNLLDTNSSRASSGAREPQDAGVEKQLLKRTRDAVEYFLLQRPGMPRRNDKEEYKDLEVYLTELFKGIATNIIIALWNEQLDTGDAPKTIAYTKSPMEGPTAKVDLLQQQLLYDRTQTQSVFSFESFLDQLKHYFPIEEQAAVLPFIERQKELIREIGIWHNRASVRRAHKDEAGPAGAFAALTELYRDHKHTPYIEPLFPKESENPLEIERLFSKGVEYSMGVWSALSLKQAELRRLWPHIDPRIQKMFDVVINAESGVTSYEKKSEYDLLPTYRSVDGDRLRMIESMLAELQDLGLSQTEAQLAYHIGESYRIGAGLEAFSDASYRGGIKNPNKSNVSVQAQEGEPKSVNIGLYVESAWGNETRPDFVLPFKDYLVHGYPPFARAAQYGCNFSQNGLPVKLNEFGDGRASLAEILAVEGAVNSVDWKSRSTNPDKVVFQAATQSTNFLWQAASVANAVKPENQFFVDYQHIPLGVTELLDREKELINLRQRMGFGGKMMKGMANFTSKLTFQSPIDEIETNGFRAESQPISGDKVQRIRAMFKDSRDYWINAMTSDVSQHPFDFARTIAFLFSRDDTSNGFVNKKISDLVATARQKSEVSVATNSGWVKDTMVPWMQGYLTYDLLMRSTFYLLKPDHRLVGELTTPAGMVDQHKVAHAYENVGYLSYEDFVVKTIGKTTALNAAQLAYVINQAMLVQEMFPNERAKISQSDYRLYPDSSVPEGYLFDHKDLLRLAQENNLGEGYEYHSYKNPGGSPFMQLKRMKDFTPTQQWLVDRITLYQFLFNREHLGTIH